jgi:hypothetical protein
MNEQPKIKVGTKGWCVVPNAKKTCEFLGIELLHSS